MIDFDAATLDSATGEIKAMYQPNSSVGGPGDKLHPNRAGYAAMANAIDLPADHGRPRTEVSLCWERATPVARLRRRKA